MNSLFPEPDDVRINARLFAAGYTLTLKANQRHWLAPDKKTFLTREEALAQLDRAGRQQDRNAPTG